MDFHDILFKIAMISL